MTCQSIDSTWTRSASVRREGDGEPRQSKAAGGMHVFHFECRPSRSAPSSKDILRLSYGVNPFRTASAALSFVVIA